MESRSHVYYSGTVQGVGFRYTVARLARGGALRGYVKNLPDGRVELVAEGPDEDVGRLLEEIRGAMGGYIRRVQVVEEPVGGEPEGFRVAL